MPTVRDTQTGQTFDVPTSEMYGYLVRVGADGRQRYTAIDGGAAGYSRDASTGETRRRWYTNSEIFQRGQLGAPSNIAHAGDPRNVDAIQTDAREARRQVARESGGTAFVQNAAQAASFIAILVQL